MIVDEPGAGLGPGPATDEGAANGAGAEEAAQAGATAADEDALARYGQVLAAAVEEALAGWVLRCVVERMTAWSGALPEKVEAAARSAGAQAAAEVGAALRQLLGHDVDAQRGTPLTVLRAAVSYPTAVLAQAGVPAIVRDAFAEQAFPGDVYGLTPATFADIDPALQEPGLVWGAAKAHVILARRRAEGRR